MAGAGAGAKHLQQDPNKFYYHFMYKAALVLIFFVILPMFPSQAPEFINQSLLTRNWELLHLLFVGVAVSYGLFSRRNHETEKDNNSKFDTAHSLVSRFLQVSSLFEDENAVESDETKVQTWTNQHYRNDPVVVVAPHHSTFDHQTEEKPLLLPVRSLKSRLSDEPHHDLHVQTLNRSTSSKRFSSKFNRNAHVEADDVDVDVQSLNRSTTTSKRFSTNFNKNAQVEGARVEDKKKENVVLASPIPWRSRMEPKQEQLDDASTMMILPSKDESRPANSQTSRASSRANSFSSSESLAKNAEDSVRKKGFYKSCPPPPPPPPPMMFHKSVSMKPFNEGPSFDKELKRSFTSERGKKSDGEKQYMQRTSFRSDKFMGHASVPLVSEAVEKKESFLDKVLVESDDDDDDDEDDEEEEEDEDMETEDEDVGGGRISIVQKGPPDGEESSKIGDEGPDVDKKADEFIAKFREQIRLQRIESIKRSTRSARNSSRSSANWFEVQLTSISIIEIGDATLPTSVAMV
ncbi:hypothetical protein CR513_17553, partial [Mucuna pruriens]